MGTAGATHRWMLWTFAHDYPSLSDEFVVVPEGFRVRLMGTSLELIHEGLGQSSPETAALLAERYAAALRKFLPSSVTLVTVEEWLERTTPPFGGVMRTPFDRDQHDPRRSATAIKAARNECLGEAADTWLRRCYDHLQTAREQVNTPTGEPGYEAYKAVEVVIERFGSDEAEAVAALGTKVKKAKRVANQPRHIPERVGPPVEGDPLALATEVVRAYERYLVAQQG
jgi:hypothetical protein